MADSDQGCCVEGCPNKPGPEGWKAWGWYDVTDSFGRTLRWCHEDIPMAIRYEFSRNRPLMPLIGSPADQPDDADNRQQ